MKSVQQHRRLIGTPIESGLRLLFVLRAIAPDECDSQRLAIYDYLIVHSNDVAGGPDSLHPATPLRSGELLVRRTSVELGLHLLIRKGLAIKKFTKSGVYFSATSHASAFLEYLTGEYAQRCKEASDWIAKRFQTMGDDALREFIFENLGRWGSEFIHDSLTWEDME